MRNILTKVIVFAAGAAIGSAVTWKLTKDKYEKRADAEIEDMRQFLEKKAAANQEIIENIHESIDNIRNITGDDEEKAPIVTEEMRNEYNKIITNNYNSEKGVPNMAKPRVVNPDSIGEDDYDIETLIYYEGDGVLTDGLTDEPIEDVEATIGEDALSRFGEFEDDIVMVRNDNHKVYYEVQRDARSYSDLVEE